jgi:hypothetical protein
MDIDIPIGMALACRTCDWLPGIDTTMGVVAAHFETEHGTIDVQLDLVVLCLRCNRVMDYERSQGARDVFACKPCHRTRTIPRTR